MIINLKKEEIAVLLLHMTISRKNVFKGLKKNYGAKGSVDLLDSYDEVKTSLETEIKIMEEDGSKKELNYNIREIEMIASFTAWYVEKLEYTLIKAGNTNKEDKKQLDILKHIKYKVNRLQVHV